MSTSALVVWLVEYFQTLEQEVTYTWPTPWNAVKMLYISNRYLVLVPVCLCLYSPTVELGRCGTTFLAASMCMVVTTGVSEAMLFLRVWALADRSRKIMIFLFIFLSICVSSSLACYILFFLSMEYASSPAYSITKCVLMASNDRFLTYAFSLIILEQTMIMCICIYLGRQRHLGSQNPLIRTFFMDGGIYFVVLTFMSMANFVAARVGTTANGYQFILAAHQGVFHSTLTNRMFLNLRELAAKDTGAATELVSRELAILNNIGTAVTRPSTSQNVARTVARATSVGSARGRARERERRSWSNRKTSSIPVIAYVRPQPGGYEGSLTRPSREIELLIERDSESVLPGEGEEAHELGVIKRR